MFADVGAKRLGMTEAEVANSVGLAGQSLEKRTEAEVNYGRWLHEADAEELVYAMGRRSDERAPVKRDDRTISMFCGSGKECDHRSADDNKRCPKKGHCRQGEGPGK